MTPNIKRHFVKAETFRLLKVAQDMRGPAYRKAFANFVKLWIGYFEKQVNEYIAYVENNPQMFVEMRKAVDDEFDQNITDNILEVYTLGMTMQEADIQEKLAIGVSMDIKNEEALAFARTRVGELIKGVDETTQKEIQAIIESALTEGKSMGAIKQEIYDKFLQYTEYRANLIAVMEMGNAFEQGKKMQYQKYADHFGIVGFKRSYSMHDGNVRPSHAENAAQGWIRATQLFSGTGTDTAPHGFNCRCNVQYSLFDPDQAIPQFLQ